VTAELKRRRANSRTASPSTADDANDPDNTSGTGLTSDRIVLMSVLSAIGAGVAVLLGRRTPAPQMEALSNSGKQLNSIEATMQRTAMVRVGSVAARISRLDHGKESFSSGFDTTGPFERFCDCGQAKGPTSKSGRRDIENPWQQKPPLVSSSHELDAEECRADSSPQVVQYVLTADEEIRSAVLFPGGALIGADWGTA